MGPATWRDWFRLRCNAIADAHSPEPGMTYIRLCSRWRWHGGACR